MLICRKCSTFRRGLLPRPATRVNMPTMAPRDEDSDLHRHPRRPHDHPGTSEAVRQMLASMEREQERRKRWPLTASGDIDTRRAMTALAQSFPTLRDVDGVAPWDADRFLAWLCGPAPSHGMRLAGKFVLGVWNSRTDWREVAGELGLEGAASLTRFDFFEAMNVWDEEHAQACRRWMEAPFWP